MGIALRPRVIRVDRYVAAPAQAAWELLTDVRAWPRWGPSVRRAVLEGRTPMTTLADKLHISINVVEALLNNETYFFRDRSPFDLLARAALPKLAQLRQSTRRLRIWSAGCSSGQEPYSIALTLLSLMPDARAFDVRILATDINPQVLETARRAVEATPGGVRRPAPTLGQHDQKTLQLQCRVARAVVHSEQLKDLGQGQAQALAAQRVAQRGVQRRPRDARAARARPGRGRRDGQVRRLRQEPDAHRGRRCRLDHRERLHQNVERKE